MSNCINDMVWEQIWEQINLDEFTLDEKHLDRVSNLAIEHGLHEDDDRERYWNYLPKKLWRKEQHEYL